MKTQPLSINEAFAARRAALVAARWEHFRANLEPDFAPVMGFCNLWEPRCNYDLVSHYGDAYVTADITRCPKCSSSFID